MKNNEPEISFIVHECMEFHTMGMTYVNIPTVEEAIKIYRDIPEYNRTLRGGIAVQYNEDEIGLYEGGYVGDMLKYYQRDVRTNAVLQDAVKKLQIELGTNFVAIESTDDYSDYYFHANMNNKSGTGKEDYFRVVQINELGNVVPYDDKVFDRKEDAEKYAKDNIVRCRVIYYDALVKEAMEMISRPEIREKRDEFYRNFDKIENDMKSFGWEKRLLQDEKTVWFKSDAANDVEEIRFDSFKEAEDYIIAEREPKVSFTVHQCMEFHDKGMSYEKIPTIEKAIETYENLPKDTRAMTGGISLNYNDDEIDLYGSGKIGDSLQYYPDEIGNNEMVRDAVVKLKSYHEFKTWTDELEKSNTIDELKNFRTEFYIAINEPVPSEYGFDRYTSFLTHEQTDEINEKLENKLKTLEKEKGEKMDEKNVTDNKSLNEMFEELTNNKELKGQEKTELLGKALKEGVKKTLDSKEFANWCKTQSRLFFNRYSFRNAMITYLQKPEASYVCGYETWKSYGRQVKKDAKSIKIFAPLYAKEYKGKGSLFNVIKKECQKQFKKDKNTEYASYRLGQSRLSFNMYKNGLWDVKLDNKTIAPHVTDDEVKKFIDQSVIGKVATYYKVVSVFDIADTTDKVDELWVNPSECKREEMILDDNGNPIKNEKGTKVKIRNSDERREAFSKQTSGIKVIQENEPEKMELLYDVLKKISAEKGIPIEEKSPSQDESLGSGALGYFKHEPLKIVISDELSLTNKVSVAFHEMAHSDLHRDLDWLKDKMDMDAGERISREMKEIQAEATACIAASAFGIETEHKSFDYIAKWSNGRELEELEKSLDVIYNEGKEMLTSIERELFDRGYDMNLEKIKSEPDNQVEKENFIAEYSNIYFEKSDYNKDYMNALKKEQETPRNVAVKCMIDEQVVTIHKIDRILNSVNNRLHDYNETDDKNVQSSIKAEIQADVKKMNRLYDDLSNLAQEKINIMRDVAKYSGNLQDIFETSPMKACKELNKLYSEMRELSPVELKYVASSEYIADKYSGLLNTDPDKFVKLVTERAKEFSKALSKNNTVVEVRTAENWGDKPVINAGTLAHPKAINKMIAEKEKNIRSLKKEAEKKDEYFPYSKCSLAVYHVDGETALSRAVTRVDIGDGEQKDLVDHLQQISKDSELVKDFEKSVRERKEPYVYVPEIKDDLDLISSEEISAESVAENTTESMDFWRNEVKNDNAPVSEQEESRTEDKALDESKHEEHENC